MTLALPDYTTPDTEKDRSREYRWRTPANDVDTSYANPELGWEAYAVLTCYHDKDRKRFVASLKTIKYQDSERGYTRYKFGLMDGVLLASEPVARYSDKALRAYSARTLADLNRLVSAELVDERIVRIMADAIQGRVTAS